MKSILNRSKTSYSFPRYLLLLLLVSACSSNGYTLTTETENKEGIPIPSVVSGALPTNGTLSAYILVDDGPRQAMDIYNGMASVTLSGLTLGQHAITMEFEFVFDDNLDRPFMLASASKAVQVGAGQNTLDFEEAEYDTDRFDEDGDGISNLAELNNNTDPFNSAPWQPALELPPAHRSSSVLF